MKIEKFGQAVSHDRSTSEALVDNESDHQIVEISPTKGNITFGNNATSAALLCRDLIWLNNYVNCLL